MPTPRPTRQQEVDIAYALESSPYVLGVYALTVPASAWVTDDALPFGVVLQPYTGESLASSHFALLHATSYAMTGRVLYADGACQRSRLFENGRRLTVDPTERDAARSRFLEASVENVRLWRLEEQAMAKALQASMNQGGIGPEVRLSLRSGVFELKKPPPREW